MAIIAVFDEEELNREYTDGARRAINTSTGVIGNAMVEQRTVDQYDFRRTFEIEYGGMNDDQLAYLDEFFATRFGRAIGFRFYSTRDHDFRNDVIGVGDGVTTVFYLQRQYKARDRSIARRVMKPIYPLVTVTVDGEKVLIDDPITSTMIEPEGPEDILDNPITVDWNTGEIQFTTPPTTGHLIRVARGEYHIPVFFNTDSLAGEDLITFTNSERIQLIEILPVQLGAEETLTVPTLSFVLPLSGSAVPSTFDVLFSSSNVSTVTLFVDGVLWGVSTAGPTFPFFAVARPGDEPFSIEAVGTNASGQVVVAGIDLLVDIGSEQQVVFTGNIGGTDYVDEPVVFTGNILGVDYVDEPVIETEFTGRP